MNAPFSFCGLKNTFGYEIVFPGIQHCFLHGEAQKVLFWNSTGAAKFLKTFQVHFLFYDQENGGKGNLGILFVLNFAIFERQYFAKLYFRDFYGGKW